MKTTLVIELTETQLKALSYLYAVKNQPPISSNVELMRNPEAYPINKDHAAAVLNVIMQSGISDAERAYAAERSSYQAQQAFVNQIKNERGD